jgi:L-malate glycosyltransferase
MRIDQVLPTFATRDAIGNHTRRVQDALRAVGIDSDIYYLNAMAEIAGLGLHINDLKPGGPDRFLMYHSSIGSPIVDRLLEQSDPIIVDYHNITPASYFEQWIPATSGEAMRGRIQLEQLVSKTILGLADSAYNRAELQELGFSPTAVAPLLIDLDRNPLVNEKLLDELRRDKAARRGPSFLFVGTLAPHKAPHELIAMIAAYRTIYGEDARLFLVGRTFGERYHAALEGYARSLGVADSLTMPGSVSAADLEAYWRATDVFVCASNHEGFCVPLIEAMGHEVPIVAFNSSAVPETVGQAGLVIDDKEPIAFAAAVHRVVNDEALRAQFAVAATSRRAAYELDHAKTVFVDALLAGIEASNKVAR